MSKAATQRDRIQHLQNELIRVRKHTTHIMNIFLKHVSGKCLSIDYITHIVFFVQKNDSEQELLKLCRVLQQEQKDLQHHQSHLAKMATLEATVKQQEEVNSLLLI